jgi:BirA family transcriptional regulator, biotin operon repressor / biotin---[acetyl-CoA-carboxylase] ligase
MPTGSGSTRDSTGSPAIHGLWGGRVRRFVSLPSTNTWALEQLARLGQGDVVWADAQTAGRGRFGRSWLAVPGKGLTFSVILRGARYVPLAPNLGQLAAWAVHDTLAGFGLAAWLKWPNDVVATGGKIAGILVEQSSTADAFVIGVGLNVNVSLRDFCAAALERPAASMAVAGRRRFAPRKVLRTLLAALQARLDQGAREGLAPLLAAWARHDWLAGHRIEVHGLDAVLRGHYEGLDETGRLCLRDDRGQKHRLWTGDVERIAVSSPDRRG